MAKKFRDLVARTMTPAAQARAVARTQAMLTELPLNELRRARALSQAAMAELMGASQPEVSKIEHRTDMYLSTLRRFVEAMGGELDVIARFPDGAVRITQLSELAESV
jgi:hypothetical protein